ncbi:MAG: OprO/OprP family phosphate-selective porin [Elusimicrobia bacterium]|nr:OprO/OprP family phosphate-selective porin [Elusimicrobiota bacterium]
MDWVLAGINGSDFSAMLANAEEDNNVKDFAGRIGYSPLNNLSGGVSLYSGKATVAALTRNRTGLDIKYEGGPYYLLAEYMTGENDVITAQGYYAEAGYRISDLQPVVRYDVYDGNTAAADNSEITITAVGLNYYLGDNAKLQFIYEGKLDKAGVGWSDADNNVWILQTAVKF